MSSKAQAKPEPVKEVKPKKKKKGKGNRYAYGETAKHYLPYIKDLQPGAAAEVPFDRFHVPTLSGNIGSRCCRFWGARNYKIVTDYKSKLIKVVRKH